MILTSLKKVENIVAQKEIALNEQNTSKRLL